MKIKRTFRNELLLGFVLVALIPLMIYTIFMIGVFKSTIERDYRTAANKSIAEASAELEKFFDSLDLVASQVEGTPEFIKYLHAGDSEEKKYLYQTLYNLTGNLRKYAEIALYTENGTCEYSTNEKVFSEKLPLYYGLLKRVEENPDKKAFYRKVDYSAGDGKIGLEYAKTLYSDTRAATASGYLVASVSDEGIEALLADAGIGIDSICLFDEYWNIIYESDSSGQRGIGEALRESLMEEGKLQIPGTDEHYYVNYIENCNVYVVLKQREIFTGGIVNTMYMFSMIAVAVGLILCMAASYFLSMYFNKPVKKLNSALKSLEDGDLDVQLEMAHTEEFKKVAHSFNRMTTELKNNIEERLEAQRELDDAHAQTMQAQLNPHFLYNTLDTMKWVAKANDVPEVATMSSGLARILRMSISGERFITLREELEFVRSYMKIQQIRFSGRFEFINNISADYENCEVPKLILQPLVENAIVHGFPDGEAGKIVLDAYSDDGDLFITITDNGRGIPEDMLQVINSHDQERLTNHHGVINVDTIIRLRYGEKYGVSASSGEKTVLTVRLPL